MGVYVVAAEATTVEWELAPRILVVADHVVVKASEFSRQSSKLRTIPIICGCRFMMIVLIVGERFKQYK